MVFKRRFYIKYRRKPVDYILKMGGTPRGTFRFGKMNVSFKKCRTLRFADYTFSFFMRFMHNERML